MKKKYNGFNQLKIMIIIWLIQCIEYMEILLILDIQIKNNKFIMVLLEFIMQLYFKINNQFIYYFKRNLIKLLDQMLYYKLMELEKIYTNLLKREQIYYNQQY